MYITKIIKTLLLLLSLSLCVSMLFSCSNIKFKVEFIVDGEVYKTVSTSDKSEIEIPKNPEKEGYEFDGWYLKNGDHFTANSLLDTPISDDMVLKVYARFIPITEEHEDFLFKACDGGYEVIGYTGDNPIVTIPSTYKSLPVLTIGLDRKNEDRFAENENIKELIIPDGVTKIEDYAFESCINLTTVTIPTSVTDMGHYTFSRCDKLSVATLPATLLEYFPKKNLTTVVINGGTSIPAYNGGFYNCKNLISVTIPDSVTSIGAGAFSGCESLTTIRLPSGITEISAFAFNECKNLTTITIPDSVTSIGEGAFSGCINLNNLTIPDNIKEIGKYAFYDCKKLTSIRIPNEVSEIGYRAFGGCDNITSVTAPAFALSSISKDSLSTVVITGGEELRPAAFKDCQKLTKVTLPDSIKSIGSGAFSGCTNLKSITLPQNLTAIENNAFDECSSLTSITIPDSVTSIGKCAFFGCTRLSKVVFQNTSGWGCIHYSWQTEPTTISNSSLSKSNTAAICLTETYVFADWTRN